MNKKISDKIKEVEDYLNELEDWIPSSYDAYKSDLKTKSACERHFEKIVEAVVDLTFLIINERGLTMPEDDDSSFFILAKENIISIGLAKKLKEAKGMRNIIAHEYGKVNDELVFEAVNNEIFKDAEEFIKCVRSRIDETA